MKEQRTNAVGGGGAEGCVSRWKQWQERIYGSNPTTPIVVLPSWGLSYITQGPPLPPHNYNSILSSTLKATLLIE